MATVIKSTLIFNAEAITASGSATSEAIPLDAANGFALHLTSIAGTAPSVTFTYSLSADGVTYVVPQSPVAIGTNKAAVDVMDFLPEVARFIKIIATNNNGSNAVTITAYLTIQEI